MSDQEFIVLKIFIEKVEVFDEDFRYIFSIIPRGSL